MDNKMVLKRLESIEAETAELKKIINGEKEYTIANLLSYEVACEVLGCVYEPKMPEIGQLKTIIRAANFIDNRNKIWTPDFSGNSYKYIPYFIKKGDSFGFVSARCDGSWVCLPAALYFKNRDTVSVIANRFIDLYNQWIKE